MKRVPESHHYDELEALLQENLGLPVHEVIADDVD